MTYAGGSGEDDRGGLGGRGGGEHMGFCRVYSPQQPGVPGVLQDGDDVGSDPVTDELDLMIQSVYVHHACHAQSEHT